MIALGMPNFSEPAMAVAAPWVPLKAVDKRRFGQFERLWIV
jgi:hypothetical protein